MIESEVLHEHEHDKKYYGVYLAKVVDTNDPLNVNRIRIICPDLHDSNIDQSMAQWATYLPFTGSPRAGMWSAPVKDDIVAILFFHGNPNNPVWLGVVHPTLRRHYPIFSQHQPAQLALNENEDPDNSRPDSDDLPYLPRDGRPMGVGIADPYGNTLWMSGVGFFPSQHKERPAPVGSDPISGFEFKQLSDNPEVNAPDMKFMASLTKYGMYTLMSDCGYEWKNSGEYGEIEGDYLLDDQFEINRAKYIRKLFTQNQTSGRDQRRWQAGTRYGHMFLMSDVGWAQPGPMQSKSRQNEYGDPKYLSKETVRDERWIKVRTKGGMLRQMSDVGLDPNFDEYIKRLPDEDINADSDADAIWSGRGDARFIRDVTRYGFKFVLSDVGADKIEPEKKENPRGQGVLIKGRRTGASRVNNSKEGKPVGFYFEIQEGNDFNRMSIGTPLGSLIELSDNYEYVGLTVGGGYGQATRWEGTKNNEFTRQSLVDINPGLVGNMLFMDNENKFIMLRSRSGVGPVPDNNTVINDDVGSFRAGFEVRDGDGEDGAWVELNDSDNRGIWMSRKYKSLMLRSGSASGSPTKMLIVMNDEDNKISIFNGDPKGKIEIYSAGDLQARIDGDMNVVARNINMTAIESIKLNGGGSIVEINNQGMMTPGDMMAKVIRADLKDPKPGGVAPDLPEIDEPPQTISPSDRGKRYN